MRLAPTLLVTCLLACPTLSAAVPAPAAAPVAAPAAAAADTGPPTKAIRGADAADKGRRDPESDPMQAAIALEAQAFRAWSAGEADVAAAALRELATRWPGVIGLVNPTLVRDVVDGAAHGTPERIGLLQALADAGYVPMAGGDASFVGYALALERLEAGDADAAKAALAGVTAPAELAKILADRRFDAIADAGDPKFDVARAARRRVDDLRARAFLDQDVLELQVGLAQALLDVGDTEDALALADEVETAFSGPAPAPFRDPHQRDLMRIVRVLALVALGRVQESEAALRAASADAPRDGRPDFFRLMLGALQAADARPADARVALADHGDLPEGLQILRQVALLQAAIQTGDDATATDALAWIRDHRTVNEEVHLGALVMAGREDEAAATVIERLRSPALRVDMLYELQDFREMPPLAAEVAVNAAWDRVVARADVQAAIAEVGRIRAYPIHRP